jgi:hypothetical protein
MWKNRPSYLAHMYPLLSSRLMITARGSQTTPVVCRVSSGNPKSSMFFLPSRIHHKKHCRNTTVVQIYYIRVNSKSLTNHKFYKPFFKLLQTISFSHQGGGVAKRVPLIIHHKRESPCPRMHDNNYC